MLDQEERTETIVSQDRDSKASGRGSPSYGEAVRALRRLESAAEARIEAARGKTVLALEAGSAASPWSPPEGLDGRELCTRVAQGILREELDTLPSDESWRTELPRFLDHALLREMVDSREWDRAYAALKHDVDDLLESAARLPLFFKPDEDSPRRHDPQLGPSFGQVLKRTLAEVLGREVPTTPRRRAGETLSEALCRIGKDCFVREYIDFFTLGDSRRALEEFQQLYAKLLAASADLLRRRAFLLGEFPNSLLPEAGDLTHDAIASLYGGERSWNPGRVMLLDLLVGVVRNKVWNESRRIRRRIEQLRDVGLRPSAPESVATGTQLLESLLDPHFVGPATLIQFPQNPEEERLRAEIKELERATLDAILRMLDDDLELREVTRLLLDGHKPGEVARRMGFNDARPVYNAARRLQRRIEKFRQSTPQG